MPALTMPYPDLEQRRRDLKAVRIALQRYQDRLASAMSDDFGRRSEFECKMLDVMFPALQIDHALANLRRWMKPQGRRTDWLFTTNRAKVVYQPKGVVGVIAAWNFPIVEAVGPMITGIGGGQSGDDQDVGVFAAQHGGLARHAGGNISGRSGGGFWRRYG